VDPGEVGQLVTSAASGDATAWQALAERFSGLVWSVTRAFRLGNADAADVFQTTWLRLAENIGRIEQPDRVGAWLATAARRECLQCLRMAGRAVPTDDIEGARRRGTSRRPVARGEPAARPVPSADPGADGVAAAQLRGGRRCARSAGGQHRPDPGPLPANAARTTGRERYHGKLFALIKIGVRAPGA